MHHILDRTHRPQQVATGELAELLGRPAPVGERLEQARVAADVLQPLRQRGHSVVVARRGRRGRYRPRRARARRGATTSASGRRRRLAASALSATRNGSKRAELLGVDPGLGRRGLRRQRPVADGLRSRTAARTTPCTVHPRRPSARARRRGRCAGGRSARTRRSARRSPARRDVERVAHGLRADVRQVDHHADPVHLGDHLTTLRR